MKRMALALVCLTAFACTSGGGSTQQAKIALPDIEVVQLSGPGDQGYPPGLFQVELGMEIKNNAAEPITLTRLDLQPMGGGGPYVLRRDSYPFNDTIAPGQTHELRFQANAYTTGDYRSVDAYAPVSIRGIANFESPAGNVRKIFVKVLTQR